MKKLVTVAINDLRLVFRDNSLKAFIALPLLVIPVIRYGFPYVAEIFAGLAEYTAVVLMLASVQGSIAFGFIYSMVLVDEKDTGVASVYGVVPVSKFWFVVFRLVPPYVLSAASSLALLAVEPFYGLPPGANLAYSGLVGLIAPLMLLPVAIVAKNKLEAMTWQKMFNFPIILPAATFFLPGSVSFVLAISPVYWAYRGFDAMVAGEGSWLYLLIGYAYSILLIFWLIRLFVRRHFK